MKVLVTGAKGQLGSDIVNELARRKIDYFGAVRKDFDITDTISSSIFIRKIMPDVIIHCAAYTAVDKAEEDKQLAYMVNVEGTRNIALICKEIGAKMVYISTDYVFDGTGEKPYEINDKTRPLGIYGLSKLEGERIVLDLIEKIFIVRISWVFGKNGNNFIKTMLKIGKEKNEVGVVCDQIGSPTYSADLAILLCDMIKTEKYGIYHATNEGYCSWAQFAEEIFCLAGLDTKVKMLTTSQYPTKAKRPLNSRLSKASLDVGGFKRLPCWKNALKKFLNEMK